MRLIDADTLGIREAEKEAYNEFVEHSKKYGNTSLQMYCYLEGKADGLIEASGRVKFAPTIDAVPVKHGKWINGKCDQCEGHAPFWSMATTYYRSAYCPHCGAKMDNASPD